jgi:SAM-dependent methyltransferase
MYTDLARWWPLLSPPQEYVEEAAMIAGLLRTGVLRPEVAAGDGRPLLLELGCGGGHNAVHLAPYFDLVLTDLSPDMLALSRRLNPGAEHVQGDMRTLRLGRTAEAVLVHDAVGYMLTETDLEAVFATARAHLDTGGVAVFVPDHTREDFEPTTGHGGTDGEDGSGVRYLEWTWDPDPADTWAQTEYSYVMREADGVITTASESHRFGVFPAATWLRLLQRNGFAATSLSEESEEEGWRRTLFVAQAVEPSETDGARRRTVQ